MLYHMSMANAQRARRLYLQCECEYLASLQTELLLFGSVRLKIPFFSLKRRETKRVISHVSLSYSRVVYQ